MTEGLNEGKGKYLGEIFVRARRREGFVKNERKKNELEDDNTRGINRDTEIKRRREKGG